MKKDLTIVVSDTSSYQRHQIAMLIKWTGNHQCIHASNISIVLSKCKDTIIDLAFIEVNPELTDLRKILTDIKEISHSTKVVFMLPRDSNRIFQDKFSDLNILYKPISSNMITDILNVDEKGS